MKAEIPAGLYVITDSGLCASAGLRQAVADAIDGGAVIVQYRDKGGDAQRRLAEAAGIDPGPVDVLTELKNRL